MDKAIFLKEQLVPSLAAIAPDVKPHWGKMNVQQMTEHMGREAFRLASGKATHALVTPDEHVPKMQEFLRSDKPFRENTVNVLMAGEPVPLIYPDMKTALVSLQQEIDDFFEVYQNEPGKIVLNPFFGPLDFELQVRLLHKHAVHHLKQFGVEL
jgi:hypothetical protein